VSAASQKQEDLDEAIHDPPGFPVIIDLLEMLQENRQAARGISSSKIAP
jgi:hypothetical protein